MEDGILIVELGCPGHFILGASCRWRRHTQIGDSYRVSTVGNLWVEEPNEDPDAPRMAKRLTVGVSKGSYFETMVFRTTGKPAEGSDGCGCLEVEDFANPEDCGHWATEGEAQEGHESMVARYAAKLEEEEAK